MNSLALANYIDHAVLDPQMTDSQLREKIMIGVAHHCRTVCVNPSTIDIAKECIEGSDTKLCVVCDFPFGQSTTPSRVAQALDIINQGGVSEIDIVANYGLIKSNELDKVTNDIKAVAKVCHEHDVILKVIVETDALDYDEVKLAVKCCVEGNADFIKTSTGYFKGDNIVGASLEVIKLIIDEAAGRIKVKASGCVRSRERLENLIVLGIDRAGVGCGSTNNILNEKGE